MSRKMIFLDVDGTLVDFTMHMPESAREALSIARKRGHLISLCTGRTVTNVYPWLLEFGFDAIVASVHALCCRESTDVMWMKRMQRK